PPQQYQQRPQQYPPRQQQAGQGPRFLAPPARAPPAPPAPQAPRQAAPPTGQQASAPRRVCYHCGQPGHYANTCPRKAQAGQQRRPAQPRAPAQGRVNHVTAEAAAEAPNVVIGTFMVNSHPATVLFDIGATHSFITKSYVEQHSFFATRRGIEIPYCLPPSQYSHNGGKF